MNLAELKRRIQTADWFANLGHAQQRGGNIAITSPKQWKQFIAALNGIEFGLAHDMAALTTYSLAAFDWLPASIHDGDQVQSKALIEIARANGKEAEFKATR